MLCAVIIWYSHNCTLHSAAPSAGSGLCPHTSQFIPSSRGVSGLEEIKILREHIGEAEPCLSLSLTHTHTPEFTLVTHCVKALVPWKRPQLRQTDWTPTAQNRAGREQLLVPRVEHLVSEETQEYIVLLIYSQSANVCFCITCQFIFSIYIMQNNCIQHKAVGSGRLHVSMQVKRGQSLLLHLSHLTFYGQLMELCHLGFL